MASELQANLCWLADQAGFRLLALPPARSGFASVECVQRPQFYGISIDASAAEIATTDYAEAVARGFVLGGYPPELYERARVIVTDMAKRARREGFDFFNGAVARILTVRHDDEQLKIEFERTSYFSDLNLAYRYEPVDRSLPVLDTLPGNYFWVEGDWRQRLPLSPLAKQANVQLIVHNDEELFYILRGRVAFGRQVVSGLPSGSVEPDDDPYAPLHELAIRKEAREEMGIELGDVSWLGFGARRSDCGILLLGTAKVELDREGLERSIRTASEGAECGELLSFRWREAAEDPALLEQALSEKLVARTEHPGGHRWNSIGPASLLLCVASLVDEQLLNDCVRRIRIRSEALGL